MDSYSGLYYPFIHFRDDRWLKLSALYWDRMGRIVPYEYATKDSDTVKGLGGFIETLRPDWAKPQLAETFVAFIDEYGEELRRRYSVDSRETWSAVPEEQQPRTTGGATGTDPRLGYIFFEKMTDDVRQRFCRKVAKNKMLSTTCCGFGLQEISHFV
jgi:hypothetical protein